MHRKERNRLEKNDKGVTGQKPQKPLSHQENCTDLWGQHQRLRGDRLASLIQGADSEGEPSRSVLSDGHSEQRKYFECVTKLSVGQSNYFHEDSEVVASKGEKSDMKD